MSGFEEFLKQAPKKIYHPTLREALEPLVRTSIDRFAEPEDGEVRFHVDVEQDRLGRWVTTVMLMKVGAVPGGYHTVQLSLKDLLPFQREMDGAVDALLRSLRRKR